MIPYDICLKVKELGFQPKHNRYSKYYLTPDYVIDFETAHSIYASTSRKDNDVYDEIEWTKDLVYIPTFEDMIGQVGYERLTEFHIQDWINEHDQKNNEAIQKLPTG